MKVEDHPLDYGWFEGVIPAGYGKGDVIVWDDGWWEPDPEDDRDIDAGEAIEQRRAQVRAPRPQAAKALRHHPQAEGRRQWLLIHKRDDGAVPGWDPEDHPRSVLSGRTNDDVARSVPARWDGPTTDELARPRRARRQGRLGASPVRPCR